VLSIRHSHGHNTGRAEGRGSWAGVLYDERIQVNGARCMSFRQRSLPRFTQFIPDCASWITWIYESDGSRPVCLLCPQAPKLPPSFPRLNFWPRKSMEIQRATIESLLVLSYLSLHRSCTMTDGDLSDEQLKQLLKDAEQRLREAKPRHTLQAEESSLSRKYVHSSASVFRTPA
jgi:hypothetical protein